MERLMEWGKVQKNGNTTKGLNFKPTLIKKQKKKKKKTKKERVGRWKFTFFLVLALSCVANKSIRCNLRKGHQ